MGDSGSLAASEPECGNLFATAWPKVYAKDPDSLRRRKQSVRVGHGAMVAMVITAVGSTLLIYAEHYTPGEVLALCLVGFGYIAWNLIGTRGVVRFLLSEQDAAPPISTRLPPYGATVYFTVQLGLVIVLYWSADRGLVPNLMWLILLPPVAYAVFMLEWYAIAAVTSLVITVFMASALRWHDLPFIGYATLAFSFALLFTVLFSFLAVQAEKARNEVQRLARALGDANRRLREYAVQAEELSATRERNRIAREIHDSVGHSLTVANVQMQAAQALWATAPDRAREALVKAQSLIVGGLRDIRQSVGSLRNSPLEHRTLEEGLRELATCEAPDAPEVDFEVAGQPRKLSPPAEMSLYRAGQEGLTNARKHSQARHAHMLLDYRASNKVSITVSDNGAGANQSSMPAGFGLMGLRERAQLLGGRVTIKTAVNQGFCLTLEVPG